MTMTFLVLPPSNPRDDVIEEIRENLGFLHGNGDVQRYSYEKLALSINLIIDTEYDKGDARRIINGEHKLSRISNEKLARLLDFSRRERVKIENELSGLFNYVVVSIPVTPALAEAFESAAEVLEQSCPDAVQEIRDAIRKTYPDREA